VRLRLSAPSEPTAIPSSSRSMDVVLETVWEPDVPASVGGVGPPRQTASVRGGPLLCEVRHYLWASAFDARKTQLGTKVMAHRLSIPTVRGSRGAAAHTGSTHRR
jgi:hypothetical protein